MVYRLSAEELVMVGVLQARIDGMLFAVQCIEEDPQTPDGRKLTERLMKHVDALRDEIEGITWPRGG